MMVVGGIGPHEFRIGPRCEDPAQRSRGHGPQDASLGTMAPRSLSWIFAPRTDPEFMRTYAADYHHLDAVWHGVTRRGVGRAATDAMVMRRDELVRTAFHN